MTENEEISLNYFNWLCSLVSSETGRSGGKAPLLSFRQLWKTPFRYSVKEDEHRLKDGLSLRDRFCDFVGYSNFPKDFRECTLLEVLVSLSEDISYMMEKLVSDSSPGRWFNEMIKNLGLIVRTPVGWRGNPNGDELIRKMLDREYEYDGTGGLFPLISPECDQRGLEIWMQANEYMLENYV